jgi:hypothetical protein
MNGGEVLDEADIEYLSESYDVNGRQIKNAVRNAIALAKRDGRTPDVDDFAMVLDKGIEFQEAVFARGAVNDMRLTGMHPDSPDNIEAVEFVEVGDSFFNRFFRGIASFFNILGGARV